MKDHYVYMLEKYVDLSENYVDLSGIKSTWWWQLGV